MIDGEPTLDLTRNVDKEHLVTHELPAAISLFEELDDLLDERPPQVDLENIVPQTMPGAELRPEPGILDGIFDN